MVIEGLLNFGISESKLFLENAKSEPRHHFWKSKFRIFVNTFSFVFHLSVHIFEYFCNFCKNFIIISFSQIKIVEKASGFLPGCDWMSRTYRF